MLIKPQILHIYIYCKLKQLKYGQYESVFGVKKWAGSYAFGTIIISSYYFHYFRIPIVNFPSYSNNQFQFTVTYDSLIPLISFKMNILLCYARHGTSPIYMS